MPLVSLPVALGLSTAFAQLAASSVDIPARAAASPRPSECSPERVSSNARPTLWRRANSPELLPYCAALARGYAELGTDPRSAVHAADDADKARPGQVAPRLLRARALLAAGDADGAWNQFEAVGQSARSAPEALHDRAVAASRTRHFPEAIAAYRSLVARAELFDRPMLRQRVYVEAAGHVMLLGPDALDEAIGYLSEARRIGSDPGLSPIVLGALALALDRQGRTALARGVATEAGATTVLTRLEPDKGSADAARTAELERFLPVLPPGEFSAIVAIVADVHGSGLARDYWQAYLHAAGDSAAWAAYARSKLDARPGKPADKPKPAKPRGAP